MPKSECVVSAEGHALIRFSDENAQIFSPETSYISIAVRRISLRKGKVNLSKYGPYLFGVLGQTNFDAETKLAGVFSPALEDAAMNLAGASYHQGSQVGAPIGALPPQHPVPTARAPIPGGPTPVQMPNPVLGPLPGTGPAPMRAESFKRMDRVLVIDKQLTPRMVYRGDGPLQLGFGGVLQKDYLADSLGLLESVVKSPVAQFVSATAPAVGVAATALDVATTVRRAFDQMTDRRGMERLAMLELSLRRLFDRTGSLPSGHYALIARENVPEDLRVENDSGLLLDSKGHEYDGAPYVVFELRCEETRPDWGSVPEVNFAWRTLESQVISGEFDGALSAFRRSVYMCADLVPADSERIFQAARRKVGPLLAPQESLRGMLPPLGAIGVALKQTYDSLATQSSAAGMGSEYARFLKCHHEMRINEGGYVDHPDDPGGRTNMGVTQRTYDEWRTNRGQPREHVRNITETEVQQIYFEGYWRAGKCQHMPSDETALILFDACVNHGTRQAMKFIQRGAGLPSAQVDGLYGPGTAEAIARTPTSQLIARALDARWSFFERIMANNPRLESFRRGWRNRVDSLRGVTHRWASGQETIGTSLVPILPEHVAPPELVAPQQGSLT